MELFAMLEARLGNRITNNSLIMKKIIPILLVSLFLPLSSAHALSWVGPSPLSNSFDNLFAPGGSMNPIQVEVKSLPSYCNHLPSFAYAWMQFTSCAPIFAQRNLQNTLQQMNENLYQQNKLAQESQRWSLFGMLRPIFAPAPVVIHAPAPAAQNAAPAVEKKADPTQSIAEQVVAAGGSPARKTTAGLPDLWVGAITTIDGDSLKFTITVANIGGEDATNVRLTPSAPVWVVQFNGLTNGSWSLGTIAGGETKSAVYTASRNQQFEPVVVEFTATGSEGDKNLADNTETTDIPAGTEQSVGAYSSH